MIMLKFKRLLKTFIQNKLPTIIDIVVPGLFKYIYNFMFKMQMEPI